MGIESPYVVWGCHPELIAVEPDRADDGLVRLLVPGSFMGRRKPLDEMLEAFMQTKDERLRLIIKGQTSRKENKLAKAADADSRIEILIEDQPTDQHLASSPGCDVCLSPTRWEGPRAAALRGDRLRPARDHERQRADERGGARRGERLPGERLGRGDRALGHHVVEPRSRRAGGSDRADRRRRRARRARRRSARAARGRPRLGSRPSRATANCCRRSDEHL